MGIRGGQNGQNDSLPFFAGGTADTVVCFGPAVQITQGLEARSYDEWVKELRYVQAIEEKAQGENNSTFQYMKGCHREESINVFCTGPEQWVEAH